MYANGFFEQQRRSPTSLALVVTLHAAAFGALILYGTTTFNPPERDGIKIIDIPRPTPPPPPPPPPRPDTPQPQHESRLDTVPQTPLVPIGPTVTGPPQPPQPPVGPISQGPVQLADATPVLPPPVRRAAEVDPNFRDALQPPYPRNQERLQRGGRVLVRITIGTNGRVIAIQQLSATNDEFWQATERQARNRWRFRPATVDGRPVESTMTMTVTFRIPDA